MKYIVEIDGKLSTRYTYNVWSVVEFEDRAMSQNIRIFCSDDLTKFLDFLKKLDSQQSMPSRPPLRIIRGGKVYRKNT